MKINSIQSQIDLGSTALLESQRGYVGNRDQVRGFMQSLYRGHPVSSLLVWVTTAFLLAGCEGTAPVPIIPYDTGGSRADGIVTMTAQPGYLWKIDEIDWTASEHLVLERCKAWGYTSFQAFSGIMSKCLNTTERTTTTNTTVCGNLPGDRCTDSTSTTTSSSCDVWQVDRNYQCTAD